MALGQFDDPGFESGGSWTITGDGSLSEAASRSGVENEKGLRLLVASAGAGNGSAVNATPVTCDADGEYVLAFWARASAAGVCPLSVSLSFDGGSTWKKVGQFAAASAGDWTLFGVPFVARGSAVLVKFACGGVENGDHWKIDDAGIGYTPATFATYVSVAATNLGGAPEGFPKGQTEAGIRVKVPLTVDGGIADPNAERVLLTSDFERE